jgi:hypothetical protein
LPRRYYKGNIDVLQGYINDIKPFHTKIKSQVDISRISEKFNLSMDDSQNSSKSITVKYHDSPTDNWTGWQLTDGVIDTLDVYSSTFTDTNADIVTGGSFTDTEGLAYGGKFLDPGNFSIETSNLRRMNFAALIREAVSITVNTNTSGDVVDSNSTVHVYITGLDNTAAVFELTVSETSTISNSISKADNIITVADSSMFNTRPDGGIAFINGEIISYTAVIGNTLQNVQRGHGGSIALEHAAGTQIIDISDASILATDMYPWVSIKDPVPHLPILGPVS